MAVSPAVSAIIPAIALLIFLLTTMHFPVTAVPSPPPPPADCMDELIAFSPCLPYVSYPPNNSSATVPELCCDAFNDVFYAGGANCFCYFVRNPLMLGFPLNNSRVLSLFLDCPPKNSNSTTTRGSLEPICIGAGAPTLPPLRSTTSSTSAKPSDTGPETESAPSPLVNDFQQEPDVLSPPIQSTLINPAIHSSAIKQIYKCSSRFLPWMMIFLLSFLNH